MPWYETLHDLRMDLRRVALPELAFYARNRDVSRRHRARIGARTPDPRKKHSPEYDSAEQFVIPAFQHPVLRGLLSRQKLEQHEELLSGRLTRSEIPRTTKPYLYATRIPFLRLDTEIFFEWERIDGFQESSQCSAALRAAMSVSSDRQKRALAWHFVRKRWEHMGVWNEAWLLLDDKETGFGWKWPWQRTTAQATGDALARHAIRKCGAAPRGEYGRTVMRNAAPVWPRAGWRQVQGDSFIASRPWFVFQVECVVEEIRRKRLGARERGLLEAPAAWVRERWSEQDIWDDRWEMKYSDDTYEVCVGWSWRHELPEPGLQNLRSLHDIGNLPLEPDEVQVLNELPGHRIASAHRNRRGNTRRGGWSQSRVKWYRLLKWMRCRGKRTRRRKTGFPPRRSYPYQGRRSRYREPWPRIRENDPRIASEHLPLYNSEEEDAPVPPRPVQQGHAAEDDFEIYVDEDEAESASPASHAPSQASMVTESDPQSSEGEEVEEVMDRDQLNQPQGPTNRRSDHAEALSETREAASSASNDRGEGPTARQPHPLQHASTPEPGQPQGGDKRRIDDVEEESSEEEGRGGRLRKQRRRK